MATITLTTPQTAASNGMLLGTENYDSVVLHADHLTAAEEVLVFIMGGKQRVAYPATGAGQAKLTATISSITLPPGPTYSIDKPVTASTCGVYASVAQR